MRPKFVSSHIVTIEYFACVPALWASNSLVAAVNQVKLSGPTELSPDKNILIRIAHNDTKLACLFVEIGRRFVY